MILDTLSPSNNEALLRKVWRHSLKKASHANAIDVEFVWRGCTSARRNLVSRTHRTCPSCLKAVDGPAPSECPAPQPHKDSGNAIHLQRSGWTEPVVEGSCCLFDRKMKPPTMMRDRSRRFHCTDHRRSVASVGGKELTKKGEPSPMSDSEAATCAPCGQQRVVGIAWHSDEWPGSAPICCLEARRRPLRTGCWTRETLACASAPEGLRASPDARNKV